MIKAPIEDIKAITILLATTVFIGNLNKTNNIGMIIKAPPAPTIPEIIPTKRPIITSKGLLKADSPERDSTLMNININANKAMIIYIVFTNAALNKFARNAPNMLPVIIPPLI